MVTTNTDKIFKYFSKWGVVRRIFLIPKMMSISDFDDTIGWICLRKNIEIDISHLFVVEKLTKVDLVILQEFFLTFEEVPESCMNYLICHSFKKVPQGLEKSKCAIRGSYDIC